MKFQFKNIFYLLSVTLLLSACGTQKKIETTRKALAAVKEAQQKESSKISSVKDFSVTKLNQGKIESTIKSLIDNKLGLYVARIDSVGKVVQNIEQLLDDKKAFRKNYKEIVVPTLDSLKKNDSLFADRLKIFLMIEDGLDVADFRLFELAAFFGPGVFNIPEEKTELAHTMFSPIVDSLKIFSNKYASINRKATLLVLGFADGTGFSEGPLHDTLSALIGKNDATKKELNQKLSELRADELIKQLRAIFIKKAGDFIGTDNLQVEYFGKGKGEAYPLPTIKDYQVDDDRRRIVLCYWVVLPE